MPQMDLAAYPSLMQGVRWRNTALTGCRLIEGQPDPEPLQSVNMVPFVGDDVIVIAMEGGHIMLPGGTREMREETGCAITTCHPFAVLECVSYDARPWRDFLPHPEFGRLVCFGQVQRIGEPENPADAEQIASVRAMPLPDAIGYFREKQRPELADIYALAAEIRRGDTPLHDLAIDDVFPRT